MPEDDHSMVRTPRKGVRSLQAYQSEVCNHPGVDGDPEVAEVSFYGQAMATVFDHLSGVQQD
jgi:hypothetical protein